MEGQHETWVTLVDENGYDNHDFVAKPTQGHDYIVTNMDTQTGKYSTNWQENCPLGS